jgi:hypothetical protein
MVKGGEGGEGRDLVMWLWEAWRRKGGREGEEGERLVTHYALRALEEGRAGDSGLADHVYASAVEDGRVVEEVVEEEGQWVMDLHNMTVPLARAAIRHLYHTRLLPGKHVWRVRWAMRECGRG